MEIRSTLYQQKGDQIIQKKKQKGDQIGQVTNECCRKLVTSKQSNFKTHRFCALVGCLASMTKNATKS